MSYVTKNSSKKKKPHQVQLDDMGQVGGISPGVAGAAPEHPLEGVAEDPAGRVIQKKTPTRMSGRDYKGGAGAVARGIPPPSN